MVQPRLIKRHLVTPKEVQEINRKKENARINREIIKFKDDLIGVRYCHSLLNLHLTQTRDSEIKRSITILGDERKRLLKLIKDLETLKQPKPEV
jgi:hypothetical protein